MCTYCCHSTLHSVKNKHLPKNYCLATVMGDYTNPVYMRIFTHKHSVKALDLCSISYCRFQLDIEVYSI